MGQVNLNLPTKTSYFQNKLNYTITNESEHKKKRLKETKTSSVYMMGDKYGKLEMQQLKGGFDMKFIKYCNMYTFS
jgi:hypothetical protein